MINLSESCTLVTQYWEAGVGLSSVQANLAQVADLSKNQTKNS